MQDDLCGWCNIAMGGEGFDKGAMRFAITGLITAHNGCDRDGGRLHGRNKKCAYTDQQGYDEWNTLHGIYHWRAAVLVDSAAGCRRGIGRYGAWLFPVPVSSMQVSARNRLTSSLVGLTHIADGNTRKYYQQD